MLSCKERLGEKDMLSSQPRSQIEVDCLFLFHVLRVGCLRCVMFLGWNFCNISLFTDGNKEKSRILTNLVRFKAHSVTDG